MTFIRIRYRKQGGHYHCRVFSSQHSDGTYAKNGDLVFDEREWRDVQYKLHDCEFIDESNTYTTNYTTTTGE